MNLAEPIDIRTGKPFADRVHPHHRETPVERASTWGASGRARGLLGGLFGGCMMAAQKSGPTTADYVQSGLIAMWDGLDRSTSTAGSWVDLIGGKAIEGATWTFGTDSFATTDTTTAAWGTTNGQTFFPYMGYVKDTPFTYEVCGKLGDWSPVLESTSVWAGLPFLYIEAYYNRGFFIGQRLPPDVGFVLALYSWANNTYGTSNWMKPPPSSRFTGTCTNQVEGEWKHYNDGSLLYSGSAPSVTSVWRRGITIGGCAGNEYCNIRIYNRALSASEIAANYAVDKARFGLT